jgi:hypothetical protein
MTLLVIVLAICCIILVFSCEATMNDFLSFADKQDILFDKWTQAIKNKDEKIASLESEIFDLKKELIHKNELDKKARWNILD